MNDTHDRNIRRHTPEPDGFELARFAASGGDAAGSAEFIVPVIDNRLVVKVEAHCTPPRGTTQPMSDTLSLGATLWLCEREPTPATGLRLPIGDVVGTRAAPLAIPTNAGLWGFKWEYRGSAHELFGRLAIASGGTRPAAGTRWMLQVHYCLIDPMTDAEWQRVTTRGKPIVQLKTVLSV